MKKSLIILCLAISPFAIAGLYTCKWSAQSDQDPCGSPCGAPDKNCKKYTWSRGDCQLLSWDDCYEGMGTVTVTVKEYACSIGMGGQCTCEGGTLEAQYTYNGAVHICSAAALPPP